MQRRYIVLALALLLAIGGGAWLVQHGNGQTAEATQPLGLFTSLPILWSEQADLRDVLAAPENPHWAKTALDQHGKIVALNTLLDLSRLDRLIIAQPRPLSPDENIALDQWVREGGKALVFVDPMLTQESAFALGDRRRPQDVVLVSPILGRWGLELRFDDAQPGGLRENAGEAMPVNLPGLFAFKKGGADARCKIRSEGLIARCTVGKGRVLLVADAALLETEGDEQVQVKRFEHLLDESFGN